MKRPEWTLCAAALCAIALQLGLTQGSATAAAAPRARADLSHWTRITPLAPVTDAFTGQGDLEQLRAEARIAALRRDIYRPLPAR